MCQTDADCVAREAGALCHPETGRCHPARDCLATLKFWYGGLAFLGGFVGALGVGTWFVRRYELPFWKTADLAAPCLALGPGRGQQGLRFSRRVTHSDGRTRCLRQGRRQNHQEKRGRRTRISGWPDSLGPDDSDRFLDGRVPRLLWLHSPHRSDTCVRPMRTV